jgi:transitional endoplasmic reticulum ATPase
MPLAQDVKLEHYVEKTEGWTGADIESVCRNAGMNAIKKAYKLPASKEKKEEMKITKEDFDKALGDVSKSIHKDVAGKKEEKKEKFKNPKSV